MKQRSVIFAPEARDDLISLYQWIAERGGANIALGYIERIERYCNTLDLASERGHSRDDIRDGLRIIGFEKRVTIAFMVADHTVTILRIYYGGQNGEEDL